MCARAVSCLLNSRKTVSQHFSPVLPYLLTVTCSIVYLCLVVNFSVIQHANVSFSVALCEFLTESLDLRNPGHSGNDQNMYRDLKIYPKTNWLQLQGLEKRNSRSMFFCSTSNSGKHYSAKAAADSLAFSGTPESFALQ